MRRRTHVATTARKRHLLHRPARHRPGRLQQRPNRPIEPNRVHIRRNPEKKPHFCRVPHVGIRETTTQKDLGTCGDSDFWSKNSISTRATPTTPIPKRDSDRDKFENRPLETRFQPVEVDKCDLDSENPTRGVLELRSSSAASTERNWNLSGAISVYYVWRMRFVRVWRQTSPSSTNIQQAKLPTKRRSFAPSGQSAELGMFTFRNESWLQRTLNWRVAHCPA